MDASDTAHVESDEEIQGDGDEEDSEREEEEDGCLKGSLVLFQLVFVGVVFALSLGVPVDSRVNLDGEDAHHYVEEADNTDEDIGDYNNSAKHLVKQLVSTGAGLGQHGQGNDGQPGTAKAEESSTCYKGVGPLLL